jgi:exodeoxyribonuclease-3
MPRPMKIATWNINSIAVRLPLVLRWLAETQPDVLCLQETKCTDDKFPALELALQGYNSVFYGQPSYNGVAILSRHELQDVQRGFPNDDATAQARLIAATIGTVRVVNVYVPNGAEVGSDKYKYKLQWLQTLRRWFDQSCARAGRVLLCGDFNVAPEDRDVHDPKALEGQVLVSRTERKALQLVKDWGLVDAFRQHNDLPGQFSWWDYRGGGFARNQGLRIDHIWVTPALAELCTAATIDRAPRAWEKPSDHTPVVGEFAV